MIFDGGLFIFMLLIGFGFMFISFKYFGILYLISFLVFMAVALVLFSGYDIAFISVTDNGVDPPFTNYNYLIGSGNGDSLGTSWLGWIMFVLGLANVGLFLKEIFGK